jgi:hypothetical protein
MGYALIWVEGMAAMFLLVALLTARSARYARRFRQWMLPLLAALPILLVASILALLTGALRFSKTRDYPLPHDWFLYTLSWTLVFLVGTTVVLVRGLRRTPEEAVPLASSWPPGRLALALAGALVLLAITLSNLDLAMKVQLAEARTEAGAVLLAMEPPAVPDKDNAAPLYEEAFAAITPRENLPPRWKNVMKAWQDYEYQHFDRYWEVGRRAGEFDWHDKDLRAFLSSQERGLTLLRRAAALPGCRFQSDHAAARLDWDQWLSPPTIHWPYGSELLRLDACIKAVDGQTQAALEDVKAILGMARHSAFAMASLEKIGLDTLASILHLAPVPVAQLRKLALDDPDYLQDVTRIEATYALLTLMVLLPEQSARWYWEWSKEFLQRKGPLPAGYDSPFWFEATVMPLWRVYVGPDDLLYIRRAFGDYLQAQRKPAEKTYGNWLDFQNALDSKPGGLWYFRYMKTRIVADVRHDCDVTTLRRMVRVALPLVEYKTKHGKYPPTLEALRPDFLPQPPRDPWDGGSLHLKNTNTGTMLFTDRNHKGEPMLSPDSSRHRRDVVVWLP